VEGRGKLGIVVTGGTKGVGFALAAAFLAAGDRVVIASRDESHVKAALRALENEGRVFGVAADVSKPEDVRKIGEFALASLEGRVDVWINNAGQVGTRKNLVDLDASDVCSVVTTNLLGTLLGCREAERIMRSTGGHCFSMDGAGVGGNATAGYAAYGATKRAVPQMVSSISQELKNSTVRFHVLSPGMVLTDLLMSGNVDVQARRFFNYLAEEPETVASALVPRVRALALGGGYRRSAYIRFLTLPKAFLQIAAGVLLGVRKNRYFDEKTGERVDKSGRYNENGVRDIWSK
jgi:chlorophyll(ide) b reductase